MCVENMMTFVQSCFRRMVMILSIHALTSTDVFQSIGMREEMYIGIVAGKKWDRRGNSGLDKKFLREREQNWRRRKPPDSQKLNSPQQAACIRLKLNVLKTGHFRNRSESDLGAGGRPYRGTRGPGPRAKLDIGGGGGGSGSGAGFFGRESSRVRIISSFALANLG